MADNHDPSADSPDAGIPDAGDTAGASAPPPLPRYEKPVLRRYDQIEQVRPYGPSEI
jgi:hypothetical protein